MVPHLVRLETKPRAALLCKRKEAYKEAFFSSDILCILHTRTRARCVTREIFVLSAFGDEDIYILSPVSRV